MAIARIQQAVTTHATGSAPTVTISSSGAGHFLVIGTTSETFLVTGITDNKGSVYVQVPGAFKLNAGGSQLTSDLWYTANTAAGIQTITVAYSGSTLGGNLVAAEYSGVGSINPVETAGNTGSLAASVVGPSLTASSTSLLVTVLLNSANTLTSVASPWTGYTDSEPSVVYADAIPGSAGTYQAVFSPSTADQFVASGAVFAVPSTARTVTGCGTLTTLI